MHSKSKGAFTLIELLVVMTIIAILAAILFPVFNQAKEAAKKTACISELEQLGLSAQLYENDNDDTFPWTTNVTYSGTTPVHVELNDMAQVLYPYIKNTGIYGCPKLPNTSSYIYNDLLGGIASTRLPSAANTAIFADPPTLNLAYFNSKSAASTKPISWSINISCCPFKITGNIQWNKQNQSAARYSPIAPISNPDTGTIYRVVTKALPDSSTFSWQIFHQDYSTSYDSIGQGTTTYAPPVINQGTRPFGNTNRETDLRASILDQIAGGTPPAAVMPTDITSGPRPQQLRYFQVHGVGANFAFGDGHVRWMTPDAIFKQSAYDGPSWDPGLPNGEPDF